MTTEPKPTPEPAKAPTVSLRRYAEHRGVSPNAVRKALKVGRLTSATCRQNGNKWAIEVDAADEEWALNTDPVQQREAHRQREDSGEVGLFPEAGPLPPSQLESPSSSRPAVPTPGSQTELQKEKLKWQIRAAKLDYERAAGDLINLADVRKQAARCASITRDGLLRIPDRISALLAGIGDVVEIREALEREIRAALEGAAEQLLIPESEEEDEDPPADGLKLAQ